MSSISPVTQADLDAIANLKVYVWINGLFMGISDSGEHPAEINKSSTPVGSAYGGENGPHLSVSQGAHAMFTPTIQGINKNALVQIDGRTFLEDGYYPLNATEPFTGRLRLQSNPDIEEMYAIVVKPLFVDQRDGTQWGSQVDNPLTIVFPKSAHVESITIPNNSGDIVKVQYSFRAHIDMLSHKEFALIGPGIDTDGTITVQPA